MQLHIAVLVVILTFSRVVFAAENCKEWNTEQFFRKATAEDVTACLEAGADLKARDYYTERTPLHMAALASMSPAVIEVLLKAGADVNARADDETPLQAAFSVNARGEPAVIEVLLAAGADPNVKDSNDWTPLHDAAYDAENAAPIKLLLAAGAEVNARTSGTMHSSGGDTPLHLAVSSDAVPAVIEALLAAGADANARDHEGFRPLQMVKRQDASVRLAARAEVNAQSGAGVTPLHSAADTSAATIKLLLDAGADPKARDYEGKTPVHFVARYNVRESGVELLLRAGADPTARANNGDLPLHDAARGNRNAAVFKVLLTAGADPNARNEYGQTPLFYAATYNESPVAFQTLLAAGADVKVRANNGQTVLHAAAHSENVAVVELLLKAGADVNARDEDGETPLHVAASYSGWVECCLPSPIGLHPGPFFGSTGVVKVLLAAGADVNARDDSNWTPLHCAARLSKNPAILEVLLAAGADLDAENQNGSTPLEVAKYRLLEIREVLRVPPMPSRPAGTEIEDVEVFRDCPTCPELVVVPAGSFRMGCSVESYACWSKNELPTREVEIASFALSKYEVTRGQFAAFVEATGYDILGGCRYEPGSWRDQSGQGDDHPVVCVNWEDAQAYVQWLRQETGHQYRLPTESEWEYAIRAGTKTRFYWGYHAPDQCKYENTGNCDEEWEETVPVGSFRSNRFGLNDMAGNVSEWVEDCWHKNYDGAPEDGAAWTRSGDCSRRVVRGGHWGGSLARYYRSANRDKNDVGFRFYRLGFRVARYVDTP